MMGFLRALLAQWVREPLIHFLLLGAGLFWLLGDQDEDLSHIEITANDIAVMQAQWLNRWRRLPTEQELQGLIEQAVSDEVYYREGLRLGLDQDDAVVRNRLIQKMRFMVNEAADKPSETDLQDWLQTHAERYAMPDRVTFEQMYLGRQVAEEMLADGALLDEDHDWQALAQPLSLAQTHEGATFDEIARLFGRAFAHTLFSLPPGRWHAPIESGYGAHAVWVRSSISGEKPTLNDPVVRQRVENDWLAYQSQRQQVSALEQALRRYTVVIERD